MKQPVVVSDDDDDFMNDDDDDDEDFEEDELVVKKKGRRRSGRSTRRSRRARDSDSDEAMPKRRPRAASLKKPKYSEPLLFIITNGFIHVFMTVVVHVVVLGYRIKFRTNLYASNVDFFSVLYIAKVQ